MYGALSRGTVSQAIEEQSSNSDDDEDFELAEEDENLAEELQDLTQDFQNELENPERTVNFDGVEETGTPRRSCKRKRGNGLGLYGNGILKLLESGGGHFTGAYNNPLLDQYYQDEPVKPSTGIIRQQRTRNLRSGNPNRKTRKPMNSEVRSRRSSSASMKSVRFEKGDIETPATIREIADSDSEDDIDFNPNHGPSSNSTESNKENVQPRAIIREPTEVCKNNNHIGGIAPVKSANICMQSSTDVQSDSSTSFDTESDSTDTSSSVSSSSDSTSSSGDKGNQKSKQKSLDNRPQTKSSQRALAKRSTLENNLTQVPVAIHTPPGQGRRRTQTRNARRRVQKRIAYLKSNGILPPTATIDDYNVYLEKTGNKEPLQQGLEQSKDDVSAFETRRKSLLDSIQSGGVDLNRRSSLQTEVPVEGPLDKSSRDVEWHTGVGTPGISQAVPKAAPHSLPTKTSEPISTRELTGPSSETKIDPSNASRRRKLDLASSRRLLFGSLGLRAPKTKADEEKLREKIMENIKPVNRVQDLQSDNVIDNEEESWKDKVILKAVECCYEGVTLSTPPFPFVQRWDPQQKGPYNEPCGGQNAKKGKKRRRVRKQFSQGNEEEANFGNSSALVEEADALLLTSNACGFEGNQANKLHVERLRSDDYQLAVDKQLMRDAIAHTATSVTSVDDLPILPEDMSILPSLTRQVATAGAVIAFKQLDMSQNTNWQPLVSRYRAAMITEVLEDDIFRVSLAQRDRPKNDIQYDQETGERLYSKFEMPDFENEDGVEREEGAMELSLADMIEPKVVKFAMPPPIAAAQVTEVLDAEVETIDMFEEDDGSLQEQAGLEVNDMAEAQTLTREPPSQNLPFNDHAEKLPVRVRDDPMTMTSTEVNEETRQEISLIIKDAGFRSNVHSDLERGLTEHNRELISPTNDGNALGANKYEPQSPKFHGFSSSPPIMEGSKHAADHSLKAQHIPSGPNGPNIVDIESSQGHESVEVSGNLHNGTAAEEWHDQEIENDDLTYPTISSYSDTDVFQGKNNIDVKAVDTDSSSPSTRIIKGTRKTARNQDIMNRTKVLHPALDGADSDEDSPSEEKVFPTAHCTMEDDRPRNHEIRKLETANKAFASIRTATRRETPAFSIADVRASSSPPPEVEAEDLELALPTVGSQPPPGTQIVDLTLSSDPVEPETSEYEERSTVKGLPNGPGWVNKTRNAGVGKAMRGKTANKKTRSM